MMAEVIGVDESVAKQAGCRGCGALVRYYENDIKERHGTDYSGGPDGARWVECPVCNYQIILERW